MRGREFKNALFDQFAQTARAFGSPKRIEIIDLLAQGERPVEAIAVQIGQTIANTSRHLQVLRGANLVASRRDGLQVYYCLADPAVMRGYRALQALSAARAAEVGRLVADYFSGDGDLEAVTMEELLERAQARTVVVLDVRPAEEYAAGHINGARSVPLTELEDRLADLPRRACIVAYCRGPYCVLAAEAVRLLRQRGLRAVRLREGYPEWRDAGLPVAIGLEPRTHRGRVAKTGLARRCWSCSTTSR